MSNNLCCLDYLTRPRSEFAALLGKDLPLGEILPAVGPAADIPGGEGG
jgi:hypothetical protein